jgi:hypothetical protein
MHDNLCHVAASTILEVVHMWAGVFEVSVGRAESIFARSSSAPTNEIAKLVIQA